MLSEFPKGFVWGSATAAYQIEGAADEDGRQPSIWDTFSYTPGKVVDGSTGDVACDHYHRWRDDIGLMQSLGLQAYRFSLSWSRIIPAGTGRINQRGMDFYERLVEGLLDAGITPYVTLYHWDLPQALQDRGGWTERSTAEAFAEYTDRVVRRLGDRVSHWITLNEPWCSAMLGHLTGEHAPGARSLPQALTASHHLLLAHGLAIGAIRDSGRTVQAGITLNLTPAYPATDTDADEEAARSYDGFFNRWFLDPIHGRGYPEDMITVYGAAAPTPEPSDLAIIGAPLDFLGINNYTRAIVRPDSSGGPLPFRENSAEELRASGAEVTAMGWEVYPQGLSDLLLRVHREYTPRTIYVTENGAAFEDRFEDGSIADSRRTAYLHAHFAAAQEAIDRGVPLRGYFVWSLMDNFEWAHGYTKRFGLTYVDYPTQRRVLKDSGHWYRQVIGANRNLPPR